MKKKEALMKDIKGYMAEAIQAKEDSDGLMLKFKTEMWDLKDDIVRTRIVAKVSSAKKAKEPPQNKDELYEAEYGIVFEETKAVITEEEAESDDVNDEVEEIF